MLDLIETRGWGQARRACTRALVHRLLTNNPGRCRVTIDSVLIPRVASCSMRWLFAARMVDEVDALLADVSNGCEVMPPVARAC